MIYRSRADTALWQVGEQKLREEWGPTMNATPSSRVRDELFASAEFVGRVFGRSAAEQFAHWVRIGREIDTSHRLPSRDIAEVLAGRRGYDTLSPLAQAVVRAQWEVRAATLTDRLDLRSDFETDGRPFVECDRNGAVLVHRPRTDW
ncbi:TA system antitoxin ParD family protein [Rhodococcus sp. NPDC003994]